MHINGKPVKTADEERFWQRVDVKEEAECWEWQAGRNSKGTYGYGVFWINGKGILTHRLALSFSLKRWVDDEEVLHECDNPPCCNPRHLKAGTHADNMRDMNIRGRRQCERGEARHCSKLSEEKVREIRKQCRMHKELADRISDAEQNLALLRSEIPRLKKKQATFSPTALSRKYGVDRNVIKRIADGSAWKHVED